MRSLKKYLSIAFIGCLGLVGAALLLTAACGGGHETTDYLTLDNGMQVILMENHASPMIASLVFVRAGSEYESAYDNGVTHFLEHLLFNGTASRTQDEIADGIERLGGYINAFTRKDMTAYLVLMPKDFIAYGMATQADMLFNSDFPPDMVAKERGIVIEEIKMGLDREGSPAESFFEEKALAGTPYSRPIIGYESIINSIPREAVIDYYKRFYAPNNMTTLIIGDFDSAEMAARVDDIFGSFPAVELPPAPEIVYTPLSGKRVFKTPARTRTNYISYSIEAPRYSDSAYAAFELLADYLADSENSPLTLALKADADPLVSSISAYLDTRREFTRLNIDLITDRWDRIDSIMILTEAVLERLEAMPPTPQLLNGYKVSRRCDNIYVSEKLHFYGFVRAPLLMVTGPEFFTQFPSMIDSVRVDDIVRACRKYLSSPACVATVVYNHGTADNELYQPSGPSPAEVEDYLAGKTYPDYDLTAGKDFVMPEVGEPSFEGTPEASYLKEVLPNGLTVIIKSSPHSRVFAVNVLGRNRSAMEPPGRDGITDFVNRMILKGTVNRSADKLGRDLASIGAQVTLYDNPWIPFDDRYTTRQYAFMKFETIDEFTDRGLELFAEMITAPRFDSVEVEKVRSEIFGLLGRDGGSTYKNARRMFCETLFKNSAYAKTINGSYRTVGAITPADLREYHRRFYSPENMIVTVGTNADPTVIMEKIKHHLGALERSESELAEAEKPAAPIGVVTAHAELDKKQVYIYLGHLLPAASAPDAPAIGLAGAILSDRLNDRLREKESLAYSVGAAVRLDKNFGWLMAGIGTGVENFEPARRGIIEEIERLKEVPPSDEELHTAVNSLWGSYLTARLSRINQVYYLGVYEYLGQGYRYDEAFLNNIRAVTPEQVREAARKHFDTENYVLATAGAL